MALCPAIPYHPLLTLRRFLQTRPATGPAAKILRDRNDTFVMKRFHLENKAKTQFDELRGWLKALYPKVRNVKTMQKIMLKEGEKEHLESHPKFNCNLNQCAFYLNNHATSPGFTVIKNLFEHATEPWLVKICIRILAGMKYLRQAPSDKLTLAFLDALIKACVGGDKFHVADFNVILAEVASLDSMIPFCLTGCALARFNESLSRILPTLLAYDIPLIEKQEGIITIMTAIGTMCHAHELVLLADQKSIELVNESFLHFITVTDRFSTHSKETDFLVPHSNLSYSEHIFALLNQLLTKPILAGPLHAVLCEMHLVRGVPFSPHLLLNTSDRYFDVYQALSKPFEDKTALEAELNQIKNSPPAVSGQELELWHRAVLFTTSFQSNLSNLETR